MFEHGTLAQVWKEGLESTDEGYMQTKLWERRALTQQRMPPVGTVQYIMQRSVSGICTGRSAVEVHASLVYYIAQDTMKLILLSLTDSCYVCSW